MWASLWQRWRGGSRPSIDSGQLPARFGGHTYRVAGLGELPYRHFLSPSDPGEKNPLIVFLHGAGGAGKDNCAQLTGGNGLALSRLLSGMDAAPISGQILAPQCPGNEGWWSPNPEPSRSGQLLLRLLEEWVVGGQVDCSRIYLVGVSMGGHGAWDLLWRSPHLFAALVPICAACPAQRAESLAPLPVWGFHGCEDQEVPVHQTRKLFEQLQSRGWEARFSELPGVGHRCTREVFEQFDILSWLLVQRKQQNPKNSSSPGL
jgi:predicted peptidase